MTLGKHSRQIGQISLLVMGSVSGLFAADVRSFGAVGNGVADDTVAVQNAVNSCSSNGTITFSPGNYLVRGVVLQPNCIYAGTGGTVTLATPNGFIFDMSQQSNIQLTGLVLDGNNVGGGIIAQGTGPVSNIQITNCQFRNVPAAATFPANLALVSTWGIVISDDSKQCIQQRRRRDLVHDRRQSGDTDQLLCERD